MTKEEKVVDLMKNKKADLVEIIIRKDDVEVELRKEVASLKDANENLTTTIAGVELNLNELKKTNVALEKDCKGTIEMSEVVRKKNAILEGMIANKNETIENQEKQLLENFDMLLAAKKLTYASLAIGFIVGYIIGYIC